MFTSLQRLYRLQCVAIILREQRDGVDVRLHQLIKRWTRVFQAKCVARLRKLGGVQIAEHHVINQWMSLEQRNEMLCEGPDTTNTNGHTHRVAFLTRFVT